MLEADGVTDIFVCGLVLDICVKSTALHGAEMGFRTTVIEDACKPLFQEAVEPTKAQLAEAGVTVTTAAEASAMAAEKKEFTLREFMGLMQQSRGASKIHQGLERALSSHTETGQSPSK